ncbi:MAG TPA: heme-binding protein [Oculatellaceae cyanobacterium]
MTISLETVSLAEAKKIIEACEKKAQEIGQPMNIAVADVGGNLVAHARMDGAWIGSIDISVNKAFTAKCFDLSTEALAAESQSGKQFFGIQVSNRGRIMTFAGGVTLVKNGKVIGSIGVSGGSGEQDSAVAVAGKTFFENT